MSSRPDNVEKPTKLNKETMDAIKALLPHPDYSITAAFAAPDSHYIIVRMFRPSVDYRWCVINSAGEIGPIQRIDVWMGD